MAIIKTVAAVPAKSAKSELDELNQLAGTVKQQEEVVRAEVGGQNSFVKLIGDPQANELKEGKSEFIKGAKYGGFVIPNKKLNLGMKFEATVVGMFKLYEETEVKSEGSQELPKIFGYWMPEDADNIPVDGIFDRPFTSKDGSMHILKPVHWVTLFVHRFPELEDVVISFRSTGNSVYNELAKMLKNNCELAPQVRLEITNQAKENKKWSKTNLYPNFTIIGKNFDYVGGNVKLISEDKGGLPLEDVKTLLMRSKELNEEYAENKMVARKANIAALIGGKEPAAALTANAGKGLKGAKAGYAKAADDDGEAPHF